MYKYVTLSDDNDLLQQTVALSARAQPPNENSHKNLSILNGRLFGRLEGNTNECVQCGITLWHTNTPQYCGREIILVELPARYYIHSSRLGFLYPPHRYTKTQSIYMHTDIYMYDMATQARRHAQHINSYIKNESFNCFEATILPPMNPHGLIQSNSDTHNNSYNMSVCIRNTGDRLLVHQFPTFFIYFFFRVNLSECVRVRAACVRLYICAGALHRQAATIVFVCMCPCVHV